MALKPLLGMMGCGTGGTAAPPPPSYTGPGDVISSAVVWYGLRAYNGTQAATGTQKAVNVRRASDNTTSDILYLTTGALDNASAATFATVDATGTGAITGTTLTFTGGHVGDTVTGGTVLAGTYIVSGASPTWTVNKTQTVVSATLTLTWGLYITRFYNQGSQGSGADLVQATNSKQPQLILNAIGSLPGARFVSANSQLVAGTISTQVQPLSFSVVALNNLSNTIGQRIFSPYAGGGQPLLYWQNLTDVTLYVNGGFGTVTGGAGGNYAINAGLNNGATSGFLQVNGTNATASYAAGGTSTVLAIGADSGGGSYADFDFSEGGIWPSFFATTPTNNLESNQRTYWGF